MIYNNDTGDSVIVYCHQCKQAPWHELKKLGYVLGKPKTEKIDKEVCNRKVIHTYEYLSLAGQVEMLAQVADYYTPDDDYVGGDISHFTPALKRVPANFPGLFFNEKKVVFDASHGYRLIEADDEMAADFLQSIGGFTATTFPFNNKGLKKWQAYEPWLKVEGCEYIAMVPTLNRAAIDIAEQKAALYANNGIDVKLIDLSKFLEPGLGVCEAIGAYDLGAEIKKYIEDAPLFAQADGELPGTTGGVVELFPAALNRMLTETYAVEQFLDYRAKKSIFVEQDQDWMVFNGTHYTKDKKGAQTRIAANIFLDRELPKRVASERIEPTKSDRFIASMRNKSGINNIVSMASWHLNTNVNLLDANPYLINLKDVTLDLSDRESIKVRKHSQDDMLSRVAGFHYDSKATCPKWLEFQRWLFDGSASLSLWNQVWAGYCLLGLADEQVFRINKGEGENGKSIDSNVRNKLAGSYGGLIKASAFMKVHAQTQLESLSQLNGLRHIVVSEIAQGAVIADDIIKDVTGGDGLMVRYLYGEPQHMDVVGKVEFRGNYAPRGTVDHAFMRRLRFVPYRQTVSQERKIKDFDKKLIAEEADGIGQWMLEGALYFLAAGLPPCKEIDDMNAEYKQELDRPAQFVQAWAEPKERTQGRSMRQAYVYKLYKKWSEIEGYEFLPSPGLLATNLVRLGYEKGNTHGYQTIKNFDIKSEIKNRYLKEQEDE